MSCVYYWDIYSTPRTTLSTKLLHHIITLRNIIRSKVVSKSLADRRQRNHPRSQHRRRRHIITPEFRQFHFRYIQEVHQHLSTLNQVLATKRRRRKCTKIQNVKDVSRIFVCYSHKEAAIFNCTVFLLYFYPSTPVHSYGMYSGDTDEVQCYLGLDNATEDVMQRLSIMTDAVEKAYTLSNKDDSILKIFLAPEFYFRGINGAFEFTIDEEEMEMEDGRKCSSDMCQILSGLEQIVADVRFENWLFLFGTVIASEATSRHHQNHLHNKKHDVYVNFAPLYRGYNPKTSNGVGKNFIVPKRYVSTADFLTPLRDLTNRSIFELLDDANDQISDPKVVPNPFEKGAKTKYGYEKWIKYKDELTSYGYNMIEYGWIVLDNITFSVEICLDHLVHRALQTYLADVVTGSQTLIPSLANDTISWVGIPKQQAQISLVSSAGMDVIVGSLVLANGGYIFLQDGVEGNLPPSIQYGQDQCTPYEYEFFGGSQSVKRTSIISATDVTFEYEMNFNYIDYNLYDHQNYWKEKLRGVFSGTTYQPKLTVYAPVSITY